MTDLMAWNENQPCHMMCINCEDVFEESTAAPLNEEKPHSCCHSDTKTVAKAPTDRAGAGLDDDQRSKKLAKRKDALSSNIVASQGGVKLKIKGLCSNTLPAKEDADPVATELSKVLSLKFILSKYGLIQNPNVRKSVTPSVDIDAANNKENNKIHSEVEGVQGGEAANTESQFEDVQASPPPQLVSKLTLKIPKFIVPADTDEEDDDEEMELDDTLDLDDTNCNSLTPADDEGRAPHSMGVNLSVKTEPKLENDGSIAASDSATYHIPSANEDLKGELKESGKFTIATKHFH